jgi:hypothetical protein
MHAVPAALPATLYLHKLGGDDNYADKAGGDKTMQIGQ